MADLASADWLKGLVMSSRGMVKGNWGSLIGCKLKSLGNMKIADLRFKKL